MRIAPLVPAGDRSARDLEGPRGRCALDAFANLVQLDAQRIRHEAEPAAPLVGDDTRDRDEGLEVHRASEAHAVHHHVGDGIVVVERDLAGANRADVGGLRREHERKVIAREAGLDARRIDRRAAGLGCGFELRPLRGIERRRVDHAR